MKIKIKSYSDQSTDFHNKEIPSVSSNHTSLVVIAIYSVFEMPSVSSNHTCLAIITIDSFLKNWWKLLSASVLKRIKIQFKKVVRHITDNLQIYSDDSDEE